MVGEGLPGTGGGRLYPVVAPALIVVGSMMLRNVGKIAWDDFTEAIPAFLTIVIMPFTYSITEGIAFGFISYALLKLVTRRYREAPSAIPDQAFVGGSHVEQKFPSVRLGVRFDYFQWRLVRRAARLT